MRMQKVNPAIGSAGIHNNFLGQTLIQPDFTALHRGDQYVTVYIETPRNLNREQKEALKKFAESVGDNNYEERKKFFKKFKK